ncbi:MAG: hypothetical protein AAGG65_04265 [Pseudomonadota bacterium]
MVWTKVALAFPFRKFAAFAPPIKETDAMIALNDTTTQLEPVR